MTDSVSWEFSDALAFDFDGYDLTVRDRCNNLQFYDHKKYEIKLIVTGRPEAVKAGDVISDQTVMEGLPRGTIILDCDKDPWQRGMTLWFFGEEEPVSSSGLLSLSSGSVKILYLPDSE